MGVDFNCYVYYGIRVTKEDIREVISKPVYEKQPRYDTKTGQITKYVNVLIKEGKSIYRLAGFEDESFDDLCYKVTKELDLDSDHSYDDGSYVIGRKLFKPEEYQRHELANGSCDLDTLKKLHTEMLEKFPDLENSIGLHAVSSIG